MKRSRLNRKKGLKDTGPPKRNPEKIRGWKDRSRVDISPKGRRYKRLVKEGKRESDLWAKVKEMPCLICGRQPADPHHVKLTSKGYDDRLKDGTGNLVPLCRAHHDEYHDHRADFEDKHDVNLAEEAASIGPVRGG